MYEKEFHTKDISNKNFLITGGAGFIGSNIVEYLLKYKAGKVRVIDNLATGFYQNLKDYVGLANFEFIEGDLSNIETCQKALQGITHVCHQAALGSVPRSIKDPIATNNANITAFLNIITTAKEMGIQRIVYASSSSVYGDSPVMPKKEENIGNPLSPYAVTKLVNELYANVFYKTYGLEIIGLRYFNIFGPRQNPSGAYAAAIPLFMNAIIKNESPTIFGDGEQSRDFTFVENAVQANIKALLTDNKDAIGQVFNIAVSERITINELFNNLKEFSNSDLKPIYKEKRIGDIPHSLADIGKAKQLLNYNPEFKVKEGLKITFDWFKNAKF